MKVHDPVCGMEIEPQSAFAKREHMGQMFYFCSQSCVDQFDKDPHRYVMTSATTGFNPERTLSRIELPVADLPMVRPAAKLEAGLLSLNGVDRVTVNAGAGLVQLDYDPQKINLVGLAGAIRSAGYTVDGTQTRIGIENLRCASCVKFIEY